MPPSIFLNLTGIKYPVSLDQYDHNLRHDLCSDGRPHVVVEVAEAFPVFRRWVLRFARRRIYSRTSHAEFDPDSGMDLVLRLARSIAVTVGLRYRIGSPSVSGEGNSALLCLWSYRAARECPASS